MEFINKHKDLCVYSKYEEVFLNPHNVLTEISNKFGLTIRDDIYIPKMRLNRGRQETDVDFSYKDPYVMYHNLLNQNQISKITELVDKDVTNYFSYELR
jgi:hypothetical protein